MGLPPDPPAAAGRPSEGLTLGLMSGTSADGVDGVLVDWNPPDGRLLALRAQAHRAFPAALRAELIALNRPGPDELNRAARAALAVTAVYAEVVEALLQATGCPRAAVAAIGAHGQTVRHHPAALDDPQGLGLPAAGHTLQLAAPAWLAERCGIPVVADFRSRDLAAGGQGAPLVPGFHQALWRRPGEDLAVLNLGGIANLTLLPATGPATGFDTGPANALMDLWAERHLGQPLDADGAWAASGRVDAALLARALAEPYFARPAPKSTGRDHFDAAWLDALLAGGGAPLPSAQDVQATLLALTVASVSAPLRQWAPATTAPGRRLIVCGGGAFNGALMRALDAALPGWIVTSSAAAGLPPQQVEATAFAWLARAHLRGEPGNLPAVTGARGPRVLGAFYPA